MKVVDPLIQILETSDIKLAMEKLTDWATAVSAKRPSLFMLSTQRAAFVGVFGPQEGIIYPTTRPLPENCHLFVKRGDMVIGFLEWDHPIDQMDTESSVVISAVGEIYRRQYVQNFLNCIGRPIDFTNRDTYFRDTAKLLSDSLSMEMVAIRQINSVGNLDCQVFFQYPDHFGNGADFDENTMPIPFRELVLATRNALSKSGEKQPDGMFEEVDPNNERYGFLFENDQLKDVKAFTLFPIVIVDDDDFFVVSCSTTAPFRFSSLEKTVIRTTMQLIRVAISNCLKYQAVKRMEDVVYDQLFSATELEIAQSARHELQNIEAEQSLHIDKLVSLTRSVKDKEVPQTISELKDTVLKLGASISRLRYSGMHAAPKLKDTSVGDVWKEATDLMQERLKMMHIEPRYVGSPLKGYYFADWLREVFLNLIFNSIDAFRARSRQNRSILLVAHKGSEASHVHVLDYSDTAGGIASGKLRVPEPIRGANPGMTWEQLIFQPRVTSKEGQKGSGWGLYLVRQALRLHKGSIDLRASNKEGCTFRIQLRKDLENLQE